MAAGDNTLQIVLSAKDQTASAFAAVNRNLCQLQQPLAGIEKGVAGLQGAFGKMQAGAAAFGVALGIGPLIAWTRSVISAVGGLGELAEQLGISTQALQAWQALALQSGVSEQQMEAGIMKLAKRVGEAAAGNKEAVESFKDLGVKILDAGGKVRPLEAIIVDVAKAITGMDSASEKSAKSQEFLGRSGARWLTIMEAMAGGTGALTEKMREQGLVVKDGVIQQLDEWDDKMAVVQRQLRNLWAMFLAQEVPEALKQIQAYWEGTKKEIEAVVKIYRALGGKMLLPQEEVDRLRQEEQRKKIDEQIAKLEEEAAFYRNLNASGINEQQRLGNLEKIRDIEAEIAGLRGSMPMVLPPVVVKPTPGVGDVRFMEREPPPGKSYPKILDKAAGESIDKTMEKMRLEADAFQRALVVMASNTKTPWPEWEKQAQSLLDVEKQIADFRAQHKLGADDPQVKRFAVQARATEAAKKALEDYKIAASDADKFERQWGSGKMELTETLGRLDRALATGRLSWEAYTIAVRQAKEEQEEQAIKMQSLSENQWDQFIAGIKRGQLEWNRANSAFEQGQQAFERAMTAMEDALTKFVQTGKLSFRDLANSIIADIMRMTIRAASSGLFKLLGDAIGSLLGGGFSGAGTLDGYTTLSTSYGGPRASGGPVIPGKAYMVGEQGPEPFVPSVPGTIYPTGTEMGGGGIVINQSYSVSGGDEASVNRAMMKWLPVMKQQALDAVMDARVRGGKFANAFR